MDILRFIPGYTEHIYDAGKEPLFVLLVSFIIAFAMTRGYTRLARTRGWGSGNVGGVHLHQWCRASWCCSVVGFVVHALRRQRDHRGIAAILFGVGAAFVLDEFALIFHLKDVYWSGKAAPRSTRPSSA